MKPVSSNTLTLKISPLTLDVDGLSPAEREALVDIMNDVKLSAEKLQSAARRWVELSLETRAKVRKHSNPSLREFWVRLERVGEGALHPQVVMIGGKAGSILGKLPIEDQARYLSEGVDVVVRKGRGWDVRKLHVGELNESQRRQVFKEDDQGGVVVRDREMQEIYMARRAAAELVSRERADALKKVDRKGWRVEGGRVYVKPDAAKNGLRMTDLLLMVRDLKE